MEGDEGFRSGTPKVHGLAIKVLYGKLRIKMPHLQIVKHAIFLLSVQNIPRFRSYGVIAFHIM